MKQVCFTKSSAHHGRIKRYEGDYIIYSSATLRTSPTLARAYNRRCCAHASRDPGPAVRRMAAKGQNANSAALPKSSKGAWYDELRN